MLTHLQQFVETIQLSPAEISARNKEIFDTMLRESDHLDGANFNRIATEDLESLFALYDRLFFDGLCDQTVKTNDSELFFRLSKKMTKAGGKTCLFVKRSPSGEVIKRTYEIAVSSTLLFQTFRDEDRPITASGVVCSNRLEALQRIFEHEVIHLIEILVWEKSSCSGARFQSLASAIFGHTESTHNLMTSVEHAATKHGIKPGDRVYFRFDGAEYVGVVNRITRRATVLVEDKKGDPYSDGKRYSKFYMPVPMLRLVE